MSVAPVAHRVGFVVRLACLFFPFDTQQRAPPATPPTADRGTLAGALATTRDRATRGAHRGAHDRTDGGVLHDLGSLVSVAGLRGRVPVAGVDGRLRRDVRSLADPGHPRAQGAEGASDLVRVVAHPVGG